MQFAVRPFSFARLKAGSSKLARMAMMAITTSNSISVNPRDMLAFPARWHEAFGNIPLFTSLGALWQRISCLATSSGLEVKQLRAMTRQVQVKPPLLQFLPGALVFFRTQNIFHR